MRTALLILAIFAGCVPTTTIVSGSSRSVLGPQNSGAVTAHPVTDTALEVTRLFEVRGFAMVDQHVDAPNGELLLKFSKTGHYGTGTVFYAWVAPMRTGSTVSLLGKPTDAGGEPCTDDGVALPCSPVDTSRVMGAYVTGPAEADIAHGVLAELALENFAIGPMPADAPPPTGDPAVLACKAQRHAQLVEAVATPDPDAKRSILGHCRAASRRRRAHMDARRVTLSPRRARRTAGRPGSSPGAARCG
jgi:hypothetical protein